MSAQKRKSLLFTKVSNLTTFVLSATFYLELGDIDCLTEI